LSESNYFHACFLLLSIVLLIVRSIIEIASHGSIPGRDMRKSKIAVLNQMKVQRSMKRG